MNERKKKERQKERGKEKKVYPQRTNVRPHTYTHGKIKNYIKDHESTHGFDKSSE